MFTQGMPIIEAIKDVLSGEEETFDYVCQNCDAEFTSATAKMTDISCPECHSTRVRSVVMTNG